MRASKPAVGLAAAHAILFAAAFSVERAWPAALLVPAPLAWLALSSVPLRVAATAVAVCQFAAWLWLLRWIIAVTAPGYVCLSLYLSVYGVLFVCGLRLAARACRWPAALLVPPVWIGVEFLRGEVAFDGYPWYMVGQPLAHWVALVQCADLLGGYFAGFLAAMVAGFAVDVARWRAGGVSRRVLLAAAAAVLGAQVLNLSYGAWRLGQDLGAGNARGPVVLAVQTNLPQDNKIGWPVERQGEDFAGFVELTVRGAAAASAAGWPADLIAWPETMLPGIGLEPEALAFLESQGILQPVEFARDVEALGRQTGTPLLVGAGSYLGLRSGEGEWRWDAHYNSAYLVAGLPPYQRYDKVFLTPFGETMPYISKWPWLERQLLALGAAGMEFDLDAAAEARLITMKTRSGRDLTMATPICFEDTSGRVCRRMVYQGGRKRADLLVNLSNDGWFGGHDANRRLHGQIARIRCIEDRVPLARCANTGLSGFFDSCGRAVPPIVSSAGSGYPGPRQGGWAAAELPLDPRSTLYGRLGDAWGWACLLGAAGAAALGATRGRRVKQVRGNSVVLGGFAMIFAAVVLSGCGMARTGEEWSTKAQSAPRTGSLPAPAHELTQGEMLRDAALGMLMSASESSYDQLRANAIEAIQFAPVHAEPLVRRGLADRNRGVRFVAAMTVGVQKMEGLAPLVEPLLQDESKSVRAGAMYAMKRCGREVDLSPLAEMIRSDDPEVRGNTALVLGELGNPSAAPMIRQAVGTGMGRVGAARAKVVDLQLAEALVKLGDEHEMDVIRAALFAPADQGEITALACMMCGRLGDERTVPNLIRLARRTGEFQHPAEVRMAATWALARLASGQAAAEVPMFYTTSPEYQLRVQAALTLGEIGAPAGLPALSGLLRDENPLVQVAAAGAILQIEGPPLGASKATGVTIDTNDGGG